MVMIILCWANHDAMLQFVDFLRPDVGLLSILIHYLGLRVRPLDNYRQFLTCITLPLLLCLIVIIPLTRAKLLFLALRAFSSRFLFNLLGCFVLFPQQLVCKGPIYFF